MSANEEYLDSLLKSVTGSEETPDSEKAKSGEELADIFSDGINKSQDAGTPASGMDENSVQEPEDIPIDIDAMLSELTNGTFDLDNMDNWQNETPPLEENTPEEFIKMDPIENEAMTKAAVEEETGENGTVTLEDTKEMTEEDIEKLLTASKAPEETLENNLTQDLDEMEISDMDDNEDIQAISSLLKKSENNEAVDNDVLELLESVSGDSASGQEPFDLFSGEAEEVTEEIPEKKKKREKRPKKERRKRTKNKQAEENPSDGAAETKQSTVQQEQENVPEDDIFGMPFYDSETEENSNQEKIADKEKSTGEKGKKSPGFFSRLFAFLTAENEGEEDQKELTPAEENENIMKELDAEDKAEASRKKKSKKDKKGGKKGKGAEAEDEAGDGKAKKKKEKKPSKPKKEKEPKPVQEEPSGRKLAKKSVFVICLLAFSIFILIFLFNSIANNLIYKNNAKAAFQEKNYEEAYRLLTGLSRNEEEEAMLHHARTVLTIERRVESYEQYLQRDQKLEALDSLMQAVGGYDELYQEALNYNADLEVAEVYGQIITILSEKYGLTEEMARRIAFLESDQDYTRCLTDLAEGRQPEFSIGTGSGGNKTADGLPDILPAETELPETDFTD